MSRVAWATARLPVRLMVACVRRSRALPAPRGGRSSRSPGAGLGALGLRALEWSARLLARRLEDPEGRWPELVNKVRAFADFRSAGEPARLRAGERPDASAAEFAELWRREGRGFLWGREAAGAERGALPAPPPARRDRLPRRELLPHHTGLGLGLATHHLERLPARASAAAVARAVDGFLEDSRRLARRGYEGAVIEALGLTVRLTRPRLLPWVDDELAARSGTSRQLFWHGLGRGLYFAPQELAPRAGDRWPAAESALRTAPDEVARHNAVAGLAWATTLVNFSAPQILAARLRSPALGEAGDAAANGIASVALLWLDAVGDGPLLRGLRDHPAGPDAATAELWRQRVTEPLAVAVDRVYPLLVKQRRIDELFRYRPVSGWARSLEREMGSRAEREPEAPVHG